MFTNVFLTVTIMAAISLAIVGAVAAFLWFHRFAIQVMLFSYKDYDAASAAKDFAIDKKDKALIWGIQKGVKGLSKNYTEDQVVALVRKCYNENLIPDIRYSGDQSMICTSYMASDQSTRLSSNSRARIVS